MKTTFHFNHDYDKISPTFAAKSCRIYRLNELLLKLYLTKPINSKSFSSESGRNLIVVVIEMKCCLHSILYRYAEYPYFLISHLSRRLRDYAINRMNRTAHFIPNCLVNKSLSLYGSFTLKNSGDADYLDLYIIDEELY